MKDIKIGTSELIHVIWCLTILSIMFDGEPDIQDAIIVFLGNLAK